MIAKFFFCHSFSHSSSVLAAIASTQHSHSNCSISFKASAKFSALSLNFKYSEINSEGERHWSFLFLQSFSFKQFYNSVQPLKDRLNLQIWRIWVASAL